MLPLTPTATSLYMDICAIACMPHTHPGADDLLAAAQALVLPKNPLDDILERLGGPDEVGS